MAQSLVSKKVAFAVRAVELAEQALVTVRELQECVGNHTDNQFAPGQAQQITQADLDGSTAAHLTPQIVADLMTAFQAIYTLSTANRAALRKSVLKPTGSVRV